MTLSKVNIQSAFKYLVLQFLNDKFLNDKWYVAKDVATVPHCHWGQPGNWRDSAWRMFPNELFKILLWYPLEHQMSLCILRISQVEKEDDRGN